MSAQDVYTAVRMLHVPELKRLLQLLGGRASGKNKDQLLAEIVAWYSDPELRDRAVAVMNLFDDGRLRYLLSFPPFSTARLVRRATALFFPLAWGCFEN